MCSVLLGSKCAVSLWVSCPFGFLWVSASGGRRSVHWRNARSAAWLQQIVTARWLTCRVRHRRRPREPLPFSCGHRNGMDISTCHHRKSFTGGSNLINNRIEHLKSPVGRKACKSTVVLFLDHDRHARFLDGSRDSQYACKSVSVETVSHEQPPWKCETHLF